MENKHQAYDLAQMQTLSLESKIRMSQQRIKVWYDAFDGDVYVSRSGGKDSDVLGDLVKKMYPDVPQIFVNTGLEFDSVREHAIEQCDEVLKPEKSFVQVITEYGYPIISKDIAQTVTEIQRQILKGEEPHGIRVEQLNGTLINKNTGELSAYNKSKYKYLLDAPFRISHRCCDVMKKKPTKQYEKVSGNKPFIGTMATESRLRKMKWFKFGCNAFEQSRPTSQPLSFWTEQDILQYIKLNNIKIADVYGEITEDFKLTGEQRTGCVFCMFGIAQDTERFLRLKELEPQKYDYIMRGGKFDDQGLWIPSGGLGYKFVIDWMNEHGNLNIKY